MEDALQRALVQLYDPLYLRKSPLLAMLRLQQQPEPARALRETLLAAIDALKPEPGTPSEGQRYYQVLYFRYVQRLTVIDVAGQLGLSPRHLRRVHNIAIARLASLLCDRYGAVPEAAVTSPATGEDLSLPETEDPVDAELAWLKDSLVECSSPLADTIEEALQLAQDLAYERDVLIRKPLPFPGAVALVPSTVLKQIVLNLVTMAIQAAPGGEVIVQACAEQRRASIAVRARQPTRGAEPSQWDAEQLDMSRRLTALYRGQFSISSTEDGLAVSVWLPLAEQVRVLVVEDNADTIQLWQRYVEQTKFRLVPLGDPQKALETAVDIKPDLVVLDVMMSGMDGWDLLAELHHHPATSTIPIIVCTVLPQKDLALSLGASDFVRKPVTRRGLLEVLERQTADEGPASQLEGTG